MSDLNKNKPKNWPLWLVVFPVIDLLLLIRYFVHDKNIALFNPKGVIAQQQHSLMVFTLTVFFIVAAPSLFLFYFIAWKYRETNSKANHSPEPRQNKWLVPSMWLVPTIVMVVLVGVMAPATHRLAPRKMIASNAKPLTIQVVSLRWKWLFIYPEQQIATVNFVQLPIDTPVTFEMTADEAPMSSFWIPNLGGQLYTMTSHVNRLNLMADSQGIYTGSSAEINGPGFADMKFTVRAENMDKFNDWLREVKQSTEVLDKSAYQKLLAPSQNNSRTYFSAYDPTLYANVISKYQGPGGHSHSE